jgi:hypothetical protein
MAGFGISGVEPSGYAARELGDAVELINELGCFMS